MGDNHTTYTRIEGTTTQWEDIQRKRGNLPPADPVWKPAPFAPAPDRPAGAALLDGDADAVSDLEGEFDDDRFLEEYRQKRLAELKAAADAPSASTTGTLPTVTKADYITRVTKASEAAPVLALLVREGGPATGGACSDAVSALAAFAASPAGRGVACVKVEADEAASGPGRLPDAALPTLLVYTRGSAVAKLTGGAALGAAGGGRITPASILKAVEAAAPGVVGGGRGGDGGDGSSSSSDEQE